MNTNDSAVRKAETAWFKSSYSGSGGGACIEVANGTDTILVRDSKDAAGPVLTFSPEEWTAFVRFAARD